MGAAKADEEIDGPSWKWNGGLDKVTPDRNGDDQDLTIFC